MEPRRRTAGRVLRAAGVVAGVLAALVVVAAVVSIARWDDGPRAEGDGCAQSELQVVRDAHVGDLEAIRRAIEDGLDPDDRDAAGNTPLACAGPRGHVPVVLALLDAGAAAGTEARDGDSVAADAVLFCQREVLDVLLDAGASPTARDREGVDLLGLAIDRGDVGIVELLLRRGVDPDSWTSAGGRFTLGNEETSPCAEPRPSDRSDALELLLERGADPDHVLAEAVRILASRAVGSALDSGADPDGRTDGLATLGLSLLAAARDPDAAATTSSSDPELSSVPVILVAAAHSDLRSVELLLAAGADPDAATTAGWTALHGAAEGGHVAVLRALLDAGASAAPGTAPLSPSEVARERDHQEAHEVLAAAEAAG